MGVVRGHLSTTAVPWGADLSRAVTLSRDGSVLTLDAMKEAAIASRHRSAHIMTAEERHSIATRTLVRALSLQGTFPDATKSANS
jgi:hypothetical protein